MPSQVKPRNRISASKKARIKTRQVWRQEKKYIQATHLKKSWHAPSYNVFNRPTVCSSFAIKILINLSNLLHDRVLLLASRHRCCYNVNRHSSTTLRNFRFLLKMARQEDVSTGKLTGLSLTGLFYCQKEHINFKAPPTELQILYIPEAVLR
jgi:hypothetical protein